MTESDFEAALNRILWKMPLPKGCSDYEDNAGWIVAELADIGLDIQWDEKGQVLRIPRLPVRWAGSVTSDEMDRMDWDARQNLIDRYEEVEGTVQSSFHA